MKSSNEILTELLEITPFLGRAGILKTPYGIPTGYFEDFADILIYRIRFEADDFGETKSISAPEEIAEISPLLAVLKDKNPYQVPTGYFESIDSKVQMTESVVPKLVAIPRANNTRKISIPMRIVRYAAAACIVGMIGITTFNLTHHQIMDPIKGLTTISEQDMANFLDVDDVHWTPDNPSAMVASTVNLSDNDIHDLLGSVPDVELEQYSLLLPEQKPSVN
ncbi:MAG TPA: hypothetical protein VFI33_15990 [Puia sp.]|nr:hypothetical protein [Puia sp.]